LVYLLENMKMHGPGNIKINGEMCMHCVEYLKTKEKSCIMAI
jgi:hypothetical protein